MTRRFALPLYLRRGSRLRALGNRAGMILALLLSSTVGLESLGARAIAAPSAAPSATRSAAPSATPSVASARRRVAPAAVPVPPAAAITPAPVPDPRLSPAQSQALGQVQAAPLSWLSQTLALSNQLQKAPAAIRADLLTAVLGVEVTPGAMALKGLPESPLNQALQRPEIQSDLPTLLQLLDSLGAHSEALPNSYSYLKTRSLLRLAQGYQRLKLPQRAIPRLQRAMLAAQPIARGDLKAHSLGDIAWAYWELGYASQTEMALTPAIALVPQLPWTNSRDPLLERLALLSLRLGKTSKALELGKQMLDRTARQRIYAAMAIAASRQNNVDQAQLLLSDIDHLPLKIPTLRDIALIHLQAGRLTAADLAFQQGIQLSQRLTDERDRTLVMLIGSYAQAGRPEVATEALASLGSPLGQTQALLSLSHAYRLRKNSLLAQQTLRQLLSDMTQLQAPDQLSVIRMAMASQAYTEMAEMLQESQLPTTLLQALVPELVEGAIASQAFDLATALIHSLGSNAPATPPLLQKLALAQANANQPSQALQTLGRLGRTPFALETAARLAAQFQRLGQPIQAESLWEAIVPQASQLPELRQQALTLGAIARELGSVGQRDRAAAVLEAAIARAQRLPQPEQAQVLQTLSNALLAADQVTPALQVSRQIPNPTQASSDGGQLRFFPAPI